MKAGERTFPATRELLILKPTTGSGSNFLDWVNNNTPIHSKDFGIIASAQETGQVVIVTVPEAGGFEELGPDIDAATTAFLRHEKLKVYVKQKSELAAKMQPYYCALEATLSSGALELIKADPDYAQAKLDYNPFELLRIIRERFWTQVLGDSPVARIREKMATMKLFANQVQGADETLGTIVRRRGEIETILLHSFDVPLLPTAERALDLLSKLNKRYEGLQRDVANGIVPITTYEAMYTKAMQWIPQKEERTAGIGYRAYSAQERAHDTRASYGGAKDGKHRGSGSSRGGGHSGGRGSSAGGSNNIPVTRITDRPPSAGSRGSGRPPRGLEAIFGQRSAAEQAILDGDAGCAHCHKQGHLKWGMDGSPTCPSFKANIAKVQAMRERQQALTVQGEFDEADEYNPQDLDTVEEGYMVSPAGRDELAVDRALLTYNKQSLVVLDTGATTHIFNPTCAGLGPVRALLPAITLGGMQNDTAPIVVDACADFLEFGEVPVSTLASANLLSQTRVIDANGHVSYDQATDSYGVTPGGSTVEFVFSRRYDRNGRRSQLYTYRVPLTRGGGSTIPMPSIRIDYSLYGHGRAGSGNYGDSDDDNLPDLFDVSAPNEGWTGDARQQALTINTVANNKRLFTKREVAAADAARELMSQGNFSSVSMINLIPRIAGCGITAKDVSNAEAIYGPPLAAMMGKTVRRQQEVGEAAPLARLIRSPADLVVDLFFVEGIVFAIGKLVPINMPLVAELRDKSTTNVAVALKRMISSASARSLDVINLRCDGEGSVAKMAPDLEADHGIIVITGAAGEHECVERDIRVIKERYRGIKGTCPFTLCRKLIVGAIICIVLMLSFESTTAYPDKSCAYERFTGRALRKDTHFRAASGTFVQALRTKNVGWNGAASRVEACVFMYPTGTSRACKLFSIKTGRVVTRSQFTIVPYNAIVIDVLNEIAAAEGYVRDLEVGVDAADINRAPEPIDSSAGSDVPDRIGRLLPFGGIPAILGPLQQHGGVDVQYEDLGDDRDNEGEDGDEPQFLDVGHPGHVTSEGAPALPTTNGAPASQPTLPLPRRHGPTRDPLQSLGSAAIWGAPLQRTSEIGGASPAGNVATLATLRDGSDTWGDHAYKVTMRAAMRDRPASAIPVITSELRQILNRKVWHPVHLRDLSTAERVSIIRSSMFLKEKYKPDGDFDKLKARLVAGGDQQNKDLYKDLSSPTAATTSVLTVAAIAAQQKRRVISIDIPGAFLNASLEPTGVKVHMRLDKLLAKMVVDLDSSYSQYMEPSGCVVVRLDMALYGCVEAAGLWFGVLTGVLVSYGFVANPYDICVLNRTGGSGHQTTITVHVDDILATSVSEKDLDDLAAHIDSLYPGATIHRGPAINYVGMHLDFATAGEVRITMPQAIESMLATSGVEGTSPTPSSATLFDVRSNVPMATTAEASWVLSTIMKVMFIAKRVNPECLLPVSFLATRVHSVDIDDVAKTRRVVKYMRKVRDIGIVLRVGATLQVRTYIDASYAVHRDSGKSHTGYVTTLGDGGPVDCRSGKQRIVTKSSTEAELVALSDTAARGIHLRNLLTSQGHITGPVIIYQDNLSTMALIRRGRPGAEGSRHVDIRYFWLKDRVDAGEVTVQHLVSPLMFANLLTKPLQGGQFINELEMLINRKAT